MEEKAVGTHDAAFAGAAGRLERRTNNKDLVDTFRCAGEALREQDRQRGAQLDLAEAPALAMEAFTETVLGIGGAVRNDLNAGNDGFFTMGKASDGLKDVVSAETQKTATRQAQEFLAAQHIAGQIDRDPEGTHEGFQTGRFKDSPVHPVTLAGLRDKAERRAREARRARQGALEAERTRFLTDLEQRVESGEAGKAELDARHKAGEIDTTRRDRLASRAELRRAEAERRAEQRNAVATVARGEAEGGNPTNPSYRRAVDDYYKSTLLPQLGPQAGRPGGTPENEARIAERLGMFVARTGVLPSRLKALWGKAIRDVDPNALKNATPEQRQRATTRAAQASRFIAAIDKSAPGLIDREIGRTGKRAADGQSADRRSIFPGLFTKQDARRARLIDELIAAGLTPEEAVAEARRIEERESVDPGFSEPRPDVDVDPGFRRPVGFEPSQIPGLPSQKFEFDDLVEFRSGGGGADSAAPDAGNSQGGNGDAGGDAGPTAGGAGTNDAGQPSRGAKPGGAGDVPAGVAGDGNAKGEDGNNNENGPNIGGEGLMFGRRDDVVDTGTDDDTADKGTPDPAKNTESEKRISGKAFEERAITVDTPDGEYLLLDNRSSPDDPAASKIRTKNGNTAHKFSRDQANIRGLGIDIPISAAEAQAINDRIAKGEEVGAVTRGQAKFPRKGTLVTIRYPNGEEMFAVLPDGKRLFAPGGERFVLDAKKAMELGLDKWVAIKPPESVRSPIPDRADDDNRKSKISASRRAGRAAGRVGAVAGVVNALVDREKMKRASELWTSRGPNDPRPGRKPLAR